MNKPLDLPWSVRLHSPHRPGYPAWVCASVRSAKNVHIATVGNVDRYYEGAAPKHAEYITRAVNCHADLLAALEHMVDILLGGDPIEQSEPWCQEICATARAAIAKARGE